jgi:drug/metabolite transporter (DMT)-like permease
MLVVVAALRGERAASADVSARSLLALLYLIGFGTMLGLTSYLWLLRRARPTLVSTYAFVNPLVAVALGALLGGEGLDVRVQVATVLLIASVAILLVDQQRARRRAPT